MGFALPAIIKAWGVTRAAFGPVLALGLAGRRVYPIPAGVPLASFSLAVLFATWSILSIGFVIASVVPTARFAQPLAALILYPMVAVSGLFFPLSLLPAPVEAVARAGWWS